MAYTAGVYSWNSECISFGKKIFQQLIETNERLPIQDVFGFSFHSKNITYLVYFLEAIYRLTSNADREKKSN